MYKNTYLYTQKSIFLVLFRQLKLSNIENLLNIYKVYKNTFFFFYYRKYMCTRIMKKI